MAVYTTRATSTPFNVYPSEVHTCGHISNEATLIISVDPHTSVFFLWHTLPSTNPQQRLHSQVMLGSDSHNEKYFVSTQEKEISLSLRENEGKKLVRGSAGK